MCYLGLNLKGCGWVLVLHFINGRSQPCSGFTKPRKKSLPYLYLEGEEGYGPFMNKRANSDIGFSEELNQIEMEIPKVFAETRQH